MAMQLPGPPSKAPHGDSSTGSELKAGEEACREASRTVEPLNDWNVWNRWNVWNFRKRLERSAAVERLERFELPYSGMQAVTVISTSSSGKFNIASTVVLAGLLVGKNLAYSSL